MSKITEEQALDQIKEFIGEYKANGPFRVDEDLDVGQARHLQELLYSFDSVTALLKEAGIMVIALGPELAVCSEQDLQDLGAVMVTGEELDELVEKHGADVEAVAHEIAIQAQTKH